QWPEDVWLEDMRLMKLANVNMASINIFSWASLEPAPEHYQFSQLDRIMDMLAENDIAANLATATASPPTWMSRLYPNMLPVTREGTRLSHGSRQHYCPNSVDFRREAAELVRRLAERYAAHPALKLWHVNNEYGCHVSACYCDQCAAAFRKWLQARYGSLDSLNVAWGTDFWSQHYYAWEDVLPPRISPTHSNPGQVLDYQRFMSDSLLECYLTEARILREITPEIPITTNFMGAFKPVDYFAWAPHLDIISNDSYPANTVPAWETAITDDLMHSLKGGQRQSQAGAEKFHSAVVTHEGNEHNRIFQQAAQLGAELKQLSADVVGSRTTAQVAILMDWQNWWAIEYPQRPSNRLHYWEQMKTYYAPLHGLNVAVDLLQPDSDLTNYRLVVAPLLYMLRPGVAKNLEQFVERGGILLTTYFSGIVDQNDRVALGGYPGELRKLLGIHVEEFDPWTENMTNQIVIEEGPLQGTYPCTLWGEVVHLEGARAIGVFANDYYAMGPALTVHQFGQGQAYYVATQGSNELLAGLMRLLCQQASVSPVLNVPNGIEVTQRVRADGRVVYFFLNHTDKTEVAALPAGKFTSLLNGKEVERQIEIDERDVAVLLAQ
ncbi:MAG: beta-galactosidase, partial [Chloroflexi bacterium]